VKSISFQLLLRLMLFDLRLYFVSVLQNISVSLNEIIYISVSISVSVNEYNTGRLLLVIYLSFFIFWFSGVAKFVFTYFVVLLLISVE